MAMSANIFGSYNLGDATGVWRVTNILQRTVTHSKELSGPKPWSTAPRLRKLEIENEL